MCFLNQKSTPQSSWSTGKEITACKLWKRVNSLMTSSLLFPYGHNMTLINSFDTKSMCFTFTDAAPQFLCNYKPFRCAICQPVWSTRKWPSRNCWLHAIDKVQGCVLLDDIITTKRWLPDTEKSPATWHTHFCTRKKKWMADFDTYQINEKSPKTRNSSKLLCDTRNKNFQTNSFKWWISLNFNHQSSF